MPKTLFQTDYMGLLQFIQNDKTQVSNSFGLTEGVFLKQKTAQILRICTVFIEIKYQKTFSQ